VPPCFIVIQSCIVLLMHLAHSHRPHKTQLSQQNSTNKDSELAYGLWNSMVKRNPESYRLVPKGNTCYSQDYKDSKETNRPTSMM